MLIRGGLFQKKRHNLPDHGLHHTTIYPFVSALSALLGSALQQSVLRRDLRSDYTDWSYRKCLGRVKVQDIVARARRFEPLIFKLCHQAGECDLVATHFYQHRNRRLTFRQKAFCASNHKRFVSLDVLQRVARECSRSVARVKEDV